MDAASSARIETVPHAWLHRSFGPDKAILAVLQAGWLPASHQRSQKTFYPSVFMIPLSAC